MRIKRKAAIVLLLAAAGSLVFPARSRAQIELPRATLKETVVSLTPRMQFSLPSGAIDMALERTNPAAALAFKSKYDLVDNFLGFEFLFSYDVAPFVPGIILSDSVDFSEFYAFEEYLQRNQSLKPYLAYDAGRGYGIQGALHFEKTYTDSTKTLARIEQGKNILAEIELAHGTLSLGQDFPEGHRYSVIVSRSIGNWGSDFEYSKAEISLQQFMYVSGRNCLEPRLLAGVPLYSDRKPLTDVYTAGGYELLRGYGFKEYRGNALLYAALIFHTPLSTAPKKYWPFFSSSLISGDVFLEAAAIGEKERLFDRREIRVDVGLAVSQNAIVFRHFPLRLQVSLAKAFEHRPPLFYFTISTSYFTWRN